MDLEYIKKVKEWVEIDNNIIRQQDLVKHHIESLNQNKELISPLIDKKKIIEDDIVDYISKNKFEKLTVNISDGSIKFGKKTTQQPMNMKLLKSILDKYSEENTDVDTGHIYDFISENIEKKTNYFMKRDIK